MKWVKSRLMSLGASLFLLVLPAQASNRESGTWFLQVGAQHQSYQLQLIVHSFPSEAAPVSGYLTNPQGQKFQLKKCTDTAMANAHRHTIHYQPFGYTYGADCSWYEGIAVGELGQPGCCKSLLILREGESVWMAEIIKGKTLNAGRVYHVPSGTLQAEFSGYKK